MIFKKNTTHSIANIAYVLTLIFTLFLLAGCYYDKEDLLYPNNCINTSDVKGPKFTAVESLIKSNCGVSCHLSGSTDGGYNFDGACSIINGWNAIYNSCVVRGSMPQGRRFNAAEKQIITDWVNAGHKYTD